MICFIIGGKLYYHLWVCQSDCKLRILASHKILQKFCYILSVIKVNMGLTPMKKIKNKKKLNYIVVISEHSNWQWHSAFSVLIYALCLFFPLLSEPMVNYFVLILCIFFFFFLGYDFLMWDKSQMYLFKGHKGLMMHSSWAPKSTVCDIYLFMTRLSEQLALEVSIIYGMH